MKALIYLGNKSLEVKEVPEPVQSADEYLIKVKACGVCGSDYEGYLGHTGRRIPPLIMGHEFSGTIVSAPAGGKYPVGKKVAIFPNRFCGVCEMCKQGKTNVCQNLNFLGVMDVNGAMTEYIAAKEKYVIPFDEKLSYGEAAIAEPLAVAYASVKNVDAELKDESSEYVLVVGGGTIGLLITMVLVNLYNKKVIVSDMLEKRLAFARKIGAFATVNPAEQDFVETVKSLTGGKMCSISFEAVGIGATARSSIDALTNNGTAVWVGNAQKTIEINMQQIVTSGIRIIGNFIYNYEQFKECVSLLGKKVFDVSGLITNTYSLDNGVEAFKCLENNKDGAIIKSMIEMN